MHQGAPQSSRASQGAQAPGHDCSKQLLIALATLGSTLATETDPKIVGSHVVRAILDVLGATRAVILVKDLKVLADGRRSYDGRSTVCRSEAISVRGFPRELLRQVLDSGRVTFCDVEQPDRVDQDGRRPEAEGGGSVCLPLLVRGQAIGLLYVELNLGSDCDPSQARGFLELIACHSALVFGTLASAETLARRDEELAGMHIDAELGRRLSDLSARLADPLTSIMLDVHAAGLWFHANGSGSGMGRNALSHVREEVRRVVDIVDQIREIARGGRAEDD